MLNYRVPDPKPKIRGSAPAIMSDFQMDCSITSNKVFNHIEFERTIPAILLIRDFLKMLGHERFLETGSGDMQIQIVSCLFNNEADQIMKGGWYWGMLYKL